MCDKLTTNQIHDSSISRSIEQDQICQACIMLIIISDYYEQKNILISYNITTVVYVHILIHI